MTVSSVSPGNSRATGPQGTGLVPEPLTRTIDRAELDELIEQNNLERMGVRPGLWEYMKRLWARRSFIKVLASSKAKARNQNSYLGQVWSILTPLLNAAVYVLIFGVILNVAREGVSNTIGFIVVGVFMFRFFEQSISNGAKAIRGNLNLVRSVEFPRAVLPISTVMTELATLLPAVLVMCFIAYLSGVFVPGGDYDPLSWRYVLIIPAVALMYIFNTGCAFIMARWVAITPDIENVIPFVMRLAMYGSGVIFSLDQFVGDHPAGTILQYQPISVYLYLGRSSLLDEPGFPPDPMMWVWGLGWAILFLVAGFLIFWRGEERYGRD